MVAHYAGARQHVIEGSDHAIPEFAEYVDDVLAFCLPEAAAVRVASLRQALWHRHVNAVAPSSAMRDWLTAGGSLTARLVAHSGAFRVQRLHQRTALCLADEARAIGMLAPGGCGSAKCCCAATTGRWCLPTRWCR